MKGELAYGQIANQMALELFFRIKETNKRKKEAKTRQIKQWFKEIRQFSFKITNVR